MFISLLEEAFVPGACIWCDIGIILAVESHYILNFLFCDFRVYVFLQRWCCCIYFPGGMQSIVISVSVCLPVCSHISKTTRPNFTRFSVHVTCGRGLVLLWWQCDMSRASSFVDDVMFPCDGGYRLKSNTLHISRTVRQVAVPVRRQTTLFGRARQVAAPGG